MSEFEILEQKILQAIKLIEKLYAENKQLKIELESLKNQLNEQKSVSEETFIDENAQHLQFELETVKNRDKVIKKKIREIIEKLNKLENLNQDVDAQ